MQYMHILNVKPRFPALTVVETRCKRFPWTVASTRVLTTVKDCSRCSTVQTLLIYKLEQHFWNFWFSGHSGVSRENLNCSNAVVVVVVQTTVRTVQPERIT